MPEITFTRSTGSYAKGATVDMGAATAAHLVQHGAAEYTNGAVKPAPKADDTSVKAQAKAAEVSFADLCDRIEASGLDKPKSWADIEELGATALDMLTAPGDDEATPTPE
jgi:hypothetical protein